MRNLSRQQITIPDSRSVEGSAPAAAPATFCAGALRRLIALCLLVASAGWTAETFTAISDSVSPVIDDKPIEITLRTNSTSDPATLSYTILSGPTFGTLSGSGATRTYTPARVPENLSLSYSDEFTFQVNDGTQDSTVGTVRFYVVRGPVGPGDGTGLLATYYSNDDFTGRSHQRIDREIDFQWGRSSSIPDTWGAAFSVRWRGKVQALRSGWHYFHVTGGDDARVLIDGEFLHLVPKVLSAGQTYDVVVSYTDADGDGSARLEWSRPEENPYRASVREIIPTSQLYPESDSPVTEAPRLTAQPEGQTVALGQSASFTVGATGPAVTADGRGRVKYQWLRNEDMGHFYGSAGYDTSAGMSTYTTKPATAVDHGAPYRCVVYNEAGSVTSAPATLKVDEVDSTPPPPVVVGDTPPTLVGTPQDMTLTAGKRASFAVSARAMPAPDFQWLRDGEPIAGATNASYYLVTTADDDGATFSCVVSNRVGQVVSPTATLTVIAPALGSGLTATYYDNLDFSGKSVQRTDATVDFAWDRAAPIAGFGTNTFSVRWSGQVQAQHSQTYTLFVTGDDGVRLRVNGQLLIDRWRDQGATEYSGTIALIAGQKYDLVLEYYENSGAATAKLAWSSASTTKQIIPRSQLYPSAAPELPSGWAARDIGNVGSTGATSQVNGTFTIVGSGAADTWDGADAFQFASRTLDGDGSIVARVVSLQNTHAWAKAGVMMREGTDAGAQNAFCYVSANNGVSFQRRETTDGESTLTAGSLSGAPCWVKLVRQGTTLTAYESADGASWTEVGSVVISLGSPMQVGLAVTSYNKGVDCTAVFDHVLVTPGGSG